MFRKALEKSEVPIGKMKKVEFDGQEILIVNVEGHYYAMGNKCTHAGGDLSKGTLVGNIVTCPECKNGASFDVTTGKAVTRPKLLFFQIKIKDVPTFEVKENGKDIFIKTSTKN